MFAATVLDVVLVLILLGYLAMGFRYGFARTLGGLLGVIAGAVVAFFAIPLVIPLLPDPGWRTLAAVGIAVLAIAGGNAAGVAVGNSIRRGVRAKPLAAIDRVLGGVVGVVAAALAASLAIGSLAALGAPLISQAASGSVVLRTIDGLTPAPVQSALARLRSTVLENGLPAIGDALGGVTDSPGVPEVDTGSGPLGVAAQSVVRITGNAFACGQNQSGSGVVIAENRVVTNAHVVAGVDAPVIEAPNGQTVEGRIVYFDPVDDLAVIATGSLSTSPLQLSGALAVGDDAVVDGYPYGGPFVSGGARVLAISTQPVDDIYGASRAPREVYTLAAVVEPGNSGGPLITETGQVAGIVFAESSNDPELGYAMTNTELGPVASQAASLDAPVSSGSCTRG